MIPWDRGLALAAIASLAILAGCAALRPPIEHGDPGRRIAAAKCTACHLPPEQHRLSVDRLRAVLLAHEKRVRLEEEEADLLRDYLLTPDPANGRS